MQPHDGMTSAAQHAAADAQRMRAAAGAQVADDRARRARMRRLAVALAAQQDRLQRRRRPADTIS